MKYQLPDFLKGILSQDEYNKWIERKARNQKRRDKKFCNKKNKTEKSLKEYKEKIHNAVISSNGKDYYTGENLDWSLIGNYNNKKLPNMPTVDHINRKNVCEKLDFVICSWKVNDMKNDMSYEEFLQMCKKILAHYENTNKR